MSNIVWAVSLSSSEIVSVADLTLTNISNTWSRERSVSIINTTNSMSQFVALGDSLADSLGNSVCTRLSQFTVGPEIEAMARSHHLAGSAPDAGWTPSGCCSRTKCDHLDRMLKVVHSIRNTLKSSIFERFQKNQRIRLFIHTFSRKKETASTWKCKEHTSRWVSFLRFFLHDPFRLQKASPK